MMEERLLPDRPDGQAAEQWILKHWRGRFALGGLLFVCGTMIKLYGRHSRFLAFFTQAWEQDAGQGAELEAHGAREEERNPTSHRWRR